MKRRLILLLAFWWILLVSAAEGATPAAPLDMADAIRDASNRRAGALKVGLAQATRQVDEMLQMDYGARGRIAGEGNARLKSLYVQAAHLLMNGRVISGGTLIVIARQEPGYARSAVGPAFEAFVAAMLAPVDEAEDVLGAYAARANAAHQVLASIPAERQLAAQLRVIGAIYGDDVAVAAGEAALDRQAATASDRETVRRALAAAGAR